MSTTVFGDIVEGNGKTVRQNNLEKSHIHAIGSVVSIEHEFYDEDVTHKISGDFFVVGHTRDCDGSPLYMLSDKNIHIKYCRTEKPFLTETIIVPDDFKEFVKNVGKTAKDEVEAKEWWGMFHFNLYGPFGEASLKPKI